MRVFPLGWPTGQAENHLAGKPQALFIFCKGDPVGLKSTVKSGLTGMAHARGYELIAAWRMDRQPLVKHLQQLIRHYGIDCILDVGGNMGQYHDMLREEVGFKGWIWSFEPVAKYVAMLKDKAVTDARWKVFDFALGSTEGTAEINVTKSPGLNSFLEPRTDAVEGFWSPDSVTGKEVVRIRVLDDLFARLLDDHGCQAPYLKLDTQGFDHEVLKGASHSLARVRALQTEASIKPLYEGMPDYRDITNYLGERGFELSGMFAVSHDADLRLIEYDCVMVNHRLAH